MSDYEGDWEPVTSSVNAFAPVVPPEPTHNYIVPRGTSLLQAEEAARQRPRRPKNIATADLPSSYRPALQNLVSGPRFHTNGQGGPIPRRHVQARVFELVAYKKYQQCKDKPDAHHSMMHSFQTLANQVRSHTDLSPIEVAKDELARICISTDAFIAVPDPESHILPIWGNPEQVKRALAHLHAWEMEKKAPGKVGAKDKHWLRQTAADGREEDRLMRKHLERHQKEMFKHYADDAVFPFETYLLWPEGYDLQEFITEYDSSVLNEIRNKFHCSIVHTQEGVRATRISSETQHAVYLVYNRLMGLLKEMVARKKRGMRLVQCHLPLFSECLDRVVVREVREPGSTLKFPELTGQALPASEEEKWNQLSSTTNRKYRTATKSALSSSIRSLHLSKKHARMRVSFGKINLTSHKRSANDQDYDIEEFVTMLQDPGVRTEQCALVSGTDYTFLDAIDSFKELGQPDYSWAVKFDFAGSQSDTLRLEREFSYNPIDPEEPSVSATRWVNYNNDRSQDELLELYHLNFGNIGYQFHIGAAALYQNDKVSGGLRTFENRIGLKPSSNGLRFEPSMHAIFPLDSRDLKEVREVTSARYPFKDTKGTLEIRRIDEFPQMYGEASAVPKRTQWEAHYYYQEWDNLMAQFANIGPGQDVDWSRDLLTFFPKVVDNDYPKSLPHGFKNFMKEVEEIQILLSQALAGEVVTTNGTNDVNHSSHLGTEANISEG